MYICCVDSSIYYNNEGRLCLIETKVDAISTPLFSIYDDITLTEIVIAGAAMSLDR